MTKARFERNKPNLGTPTNAPIIRSAVLVMTQIADVLTVASIEIDGIIDADYKLIVYLTTSIGFGITKPKAGLFKLIASMDPVVSPSVNDFTVEYNNRFGVPEIGTKIYCRYALISRTSGLRFDLGQENVLVN